ERILHRSTRTPAAGFLSGVGLTVLVQSSSATTLATIGFVSAGLLSFPSAIGVIVGANVGTTSTGWIVSLLGFKVDVAAITLPLIGVGAMLRLLTAGSKARIGMALVGFGLIFVGIDFLQDGMAGIQQRIDLSGFSAATFGGRLGLVFIGLVMTVILQSSSAAVALTLTALYSGAIGLEQSAYLVIGQNVGTTVTAALAAVGASVPAQRTAIVHILFNVATAIVAFAIAGMLLDVSGMVAGATGQADLAVQIACFHTLFNATGALLVMPVTRPLGRFVTRLIADSGPQLTQNLDRSLLTVPAVATEASSRALRRTAAVALEELIRTLRGEWPDRRSQERIDAAADAERSIVSFLAEIDLGSTAGDLVDRRLSLFHAGDHVAALVAIHREAARPLYGARAKEAARLLLPVLESAVGWLSEEPSPGANGDDAERAREIAHALQEASAELAEIRRRHRAAILARTATGEMHPDEAQRRLGAMRRVDRIGYHTWRDMHHFAGMTDSVADAVNGFDPTAAASVAVEAGETAP